MPKTDLIRVQIIKLGGKNLVDIRRCITTKSGEPLPTKRGLSVPLELLPEILERIKKANGKPEYIEL